MKSEKNRRKSHSVGCSVYLLCNFEYSEQSQSPEGREAKTSRAFMEVDPEHFEDGASDNNGVETVEGRVEESHRTEGIHPNQHLKDECTQEHEFHINCNQNW